MPNNTPNNLKKVYCQACGRFLGYHNLIEGEVYIRCKCGEFSVILEGKKAETLTGKDIYAKLKTNRE